MPNDPTLYPGIPNPQQQMIQRIVALEARMQTQERRRDLVVTPFTTGGSASGTWYGGRMWIILAGEATWTTPPSAGNKAIGADVSLNGHVFRSIGASGYAAAVNDLIHFALPLVSVELNPATLTSTYGLGIGSTWTITSATTGAGGGASVSGLVIEWPQA